jgi:hypothetical protein
MVSPIGSSDAMTGTLSADVESLIDNASFLPWTID